jgi:hypothetical protein
VGQQVQTLVGVEAGEQEGPLLGGSQGRRDHAGEPLARQSLEAAP